jgi:hypothetical protein
MASARICFRKLQKLKKIWTVRLKSDEFQPSQYTKLCERHFEKDRFAVNPELAVSIRVPNKCKNVDLGSSTIHFFYHSNPKTKFGSHGKRLSKSPLSMYKALKRRHFLNHNVTEEIEKRNNSSIFSKTGRIYSDSRISYIERESEVLEI